MPRGEHILSPRILSFKEPVIKWPLKKPQPGLHQEGGLDSLTTPSCQQHRLRQTKGGEETPRGLMKFQQPTASPRNRTVTSKALGLMSLKETKAPVSAGDQRKEHGSIVGGYLKKMGCTFVLRGTQFLHPWIPVPPHQVQPIPRVLKCPRVFQI